MGKVGRKATVKKQCIAVSSMITGLVGRLTTSREFPGSLEHLAPTEVCSNRFCLSIIFWLNFYFFATSATFFKRIV